jgi:hypothetical protein
MDYLHRNLPNFPVEIPAGRLVSQTDRILIYLELTQVFCRFCKDVAGYRPALLFNNGFWGHNPREDGYFPVQCDASMFWDMIHATTPTQAEAEVTK